MCEVLLWSLSFVILTKRGLHIQYLGLWSLWVAGILISFLMNRREVIFSSEEVGSHLNWEQITMPSRRNEMG